MRKRRKNIVRDIKAESKVFEPIVYDTSGVDRLNAIPDFKAQLAKNWSEKVILKYWVMNQEQLAEAAKDKTITVYERMILGQVAETLRAGSKNAFNYAKHLTERVEGMAIATIAHTGPDGQPLVNTTSGGIDKMLEGMSDKDLENYEKALKFISKIKSKNEKAA